MSHENVRASKSETVPFTHLDASSSAPSESELAATKKHISESDPDASGDSGTENVKGQSTSPSSHGDDLVGEIGAMLEEFKAHFPVEEAQHKTPRVPRRRPRRTEERGLPLREDLIALARTWLETQRQLWPDLVESGELPPVTEETLVKLAEDFEQRFLNKEIVRYQPKKPLPRGVALGIAYERYSSDKSNPRSLDQQLLLELKRAAVDRVFIPWEHVFADAAVTGTNAAARHGYTLLKQSIGQWHGEGFDCLYIDEIGRAARDAVEAMSLGRLLDNLRKRLIGVSDGFDSTSPDAKLRLGIFAVLEEYYIEQLRHRIRRGRNHTFFKSETAFKPPALGYRLAPAFDAKGNPIIGADGVQLNRDEVDPESMPYVLLAWTLRGERRWSRERIAQLFNELKVAGRDTWVPSSIRQLFKRTDYIGVEIDGQYRVYRNSENTLVMERRPSREWRIRKAPHKKVLPDELWKKVRRLEYQCHLAYVSKRKDRPTRSQIHATTPWSGNLVCDYCESELGLGHSGSHPQYRCFNGIHGRCGCKLKGYKSARIIGNSIFDFLKQEIFTDIRKEDVFQKASAHVEFLRHRPKPDTAALKRLITELDRKIERLLEKVENEQNEGLRARYHERARSKEEELEQLRAKLVKAEANYVIPAENLSREAVNAMLDDLWGLLNQADPGEVAPMIRALMGPIRISQKLVEGQPKLVWIAKFKVNLVETMVILAQQKKYPTAGSLDLLKNSGWIIPITAEIVLRHKDRLSRLGPQVKELVHQFEQDHGSRRGAIQHAANILHIIWTEARNALIWVEQGKRPKSSRRKTKKAEPAARGGRCRRGEAPIFEVIAPKVVHMRDAQRRNWPDIAAAVGRCIATCQRGYDHHHTEDRKLSAASGQKYRRGGHSRLTVEAVALLHQLLTPFLDKALTRAASKGIAVLVGCESKTVYRERRRLQRETADKVPEHVEIGSIDPAM